MPTNIELKKQIEDNLASFTTGSLKENSRRLFETLGYASEKKIEFRPNTAEGFLSFLSSNAAPAINEEKAQIKEWESVDFLFQLTDEEISNSLFDTDEVDITNVRIESYLFFAIKLKQTEYRRSDLANITREINKVFPMPVMILFQHGTSLTFSIIDRRLNKLDSSKDVLQKVTLIKDIRLENPHRAHIEILSDLSKDNFEVVNFVELHKAWQRVLDTKELNKKFFQELANWYFWAVDSVEFPDDEEKNGEIRNATSVIRLITRLIFVWFLKEKGLVSEKLFDERYLKSILNFNDESTFYKAVLQNLFFATLNSEMGTRKFIAESNGGRNTQHFVHNVFRYKREFRKPEDTIKELFEPIPFLNGGLFECLDKEVEDADGTTTRIRVDGFSDHKSNVVNVPDNLFFVKEEQVDLSDVYDDARKSKVKVRGLINILNSYKFTITENTPIEEEIALDPELLGRVFENLLASYNPETKTTARKQTGSFYTPREIVNYMVDEALIAYLKQKLQTETEGFAGFIAFGEDQTSMFGNEARTQQKFEMPVNNNSWHGKDEELDDALKELFSYTDEGHKFSELETEILIKAIDNCKILDPACGSGAFPMGILQRLVQLLSKLDEDNSMWKHWQKQKAIEATKQAFDIGNSKEREERLLEINDVFENNASDFGRKLFLIENCIYGVDIQPIAIQIAKLRFFISLIVDERTNLNKENLGIRPLPNLETKFVAANSLFGLDDAQGSFARQLVRSLEEDLRVIRAGHFRARYRREKNRYREADSVKRSEISETLKQSGFPVTSANNIAEWNPYNQNTTADWFDPEWMFSVESRFDIVIGNPPYFVYEGTQAGELHKLNQIELYEPARVGKLNAYKLFLLKSHELTKSSGIIAEIFQNSFLADNSATGVRNFYLNKAQVISIDSFPERDNANKRVFPAVKMSVCILVAQKKDATDYSFTVNTWQERERENGFQTKFKKSEIKLFDETKLVIPSLREDEKTIFRNFYKHRPIGEKYQCYQGELNMSSQRAYFTSGRNEFMALKGAQIQRYRLLTDAMSQGEIEFVDIKKYQRDFNTPKSRHHENIRLVMQGITGVNEETRLKSVLVPENYFCAHSCNYIVNDNAEELEFLLGLLNSTLHNWVFKKTSTNSNVNSYEIEALTIPKSTEQERANVAKLVREIMNARIKNPKTDTLEREKEIDRQVYKLYSLTEDEIRIIEGKN